MYRCKFCIHFANCVISGLSIYIISPAFCLVCFVRYLFCLLAFLGESNLFVASLLYTAYFVVLLICFVPRQHRVLFLCFALSGACARALFPLHLIHGAAVSSPVSYLVLYTRRLYDFLPDLDANLDAHMTVMAVVRLY